MKLMGTKHNADTQSIIGFRGGMGAPAQLVISDKWLVVSDWRISLLSTLNSKLSTRLGVPA